MNEELTFEQASERLEAIIKVLEDAKTPLDEAMALFEEGVALIKQANTVLTAAEQKVITLTTKKENE